MTATLGAHDLRLELTDALGERAANAGAGEHGGGLDADEDLVLEARDVVAVGDARGEPAHDARLADARRADEARVVRVALREHVERALDLRLAAHHRIELATDRELREVLSELHEQRKLLRVEDEAIPAAHSSRPRACPWLRSTPPSAPWSRG